MGADIHWIIERRHARGQWEAVASKAWLAHSMGWDFTDLDYDDPRRDFGERHYELFSLLSDLRRAQMPHEEDVATEDLPPDASEHARIAFDAGDGPFRLRHTVGHYSLGRLRAVVEGGPADDVRPCEEGREILHSYLGCLEALIEGPCAIDLTRILFGAEHDEDHRPFREMAQESNHAAMERAGRERELEPIGPDTLRVIISYDN